MKQKTLLSWSSGKDCAWALYKLRKDPEIELTGLFCTVNTKFKRVSMHAVRLELLKCQAEALGVPLKIIEIPYPCSNVDYEKAMARFVEQAKEDGITHFAFGDLFLEEVRDYRIEKLEGTGIKPLFPLWGMPTGELSVEMIERGVKAVVTCADPEQIPSDCIGREYNNSFLDDLPEGTDPCGENGEFHTFVFGGPMFSKSINISLGEIVNRDGVIYIDLDLS